MNPDLTRVKPGGHGGGAHLVASEPSPGNDAGTARHRPASAGPGRVAAILPVYRSAYFAEALRSVVEQSHPATEIVVIDDGSPERAHVEQTVRQYSDRVTLIQQENFGAAAARNRGIAATDAEFIALLDGDDVWRSDFLRDQMAMFAADPTLDLVYTDGLIAGDTLLAGQTFMESCPSEGAVTLESLLAQRNTVLLSAVVARRRALLAVGGFDASLRRGQDFDLWLRMAANGARMGYQRKVLVVRRLHGANLSGTAIDELERPLRVLERALERMSLSPEERHVATFRVAELRGMLAREQGKEYLRSGRFQEARGALRRASTGPGRWKVQLALIALQLAPGLFRRLYLARAHSAGALRRRLRRG